MSAKQFADPVKRDLSKHILILDFGSQYTQLIARRVRELGVYSEILPCYTEPSSVDLSEVGALILSGGPASVTDSNAPKFNPEWFEFKLPTLGICYGMQLIAQHFDGSLGQGQSREYGRASISIVSETPLFDKVKSGTATTVWMSHGDHVEKLPNGFSCLAKSSGAPIAAMGDSKRAIYALQFHPEVVHTELGRDILSNFIFKLAKLESNWSPEDFVKSSLDKINTEVGPDSKVICGLSGGVDSSVAAVLVHRAVGERLHCLMIDNGLMRKDEARKVVEKLGKGGFGLDIEIVDARARFLKELKGVLDPEQKRKIIGRVFIEVFEECAKRIANVTHLVQGTLYPDVIESVSAFGPSHTIKTHHNVGGLPERMDLKLIEPFRHLFKDEVRVLGRELGLSEDVLMRQPFPGPGLGVRIVGEITEQRLEMLREADAIFVEEVRNAGLYQKLWQTFAVLLPVRSVGVMGDGRTYEETIALRAVSSEDGMTADWVYLPHEVLRAASSKIINQIKGINRVVLDISSKPPATIEWE